MPYDDPDPEDPMQLVGVGLPTGDLDSVVDMAECFVEEFLRLGHPQDQVLEMFRNPFYRAAHGAYEALGEERIASIVEAYGPLFRFRQRRIQV
jgi:hypothetical protein